MRAYWAQISINLKLTFRDRTALFFNYLFPLIFFFMFGQLMHAERGGASTEVVNMVLTIGILGSGFFGAGIRAVMDREQNILRRFKVAPITAAPILVSSLVTGLVHYLPVAVLTIVMAHFFYGMPWPDHLVSLFLFLTLGVLAFRSLGMIIAAVANSMQESQIIIQLLYFPMLLLSGATIPMSILPTWVQLLAQFLPATHLATGLEAILTGKESILQNGMAVLALLMTTALATFLGVKLFRWEKEEKMRGSAKLWLLAVLAPFLLIGGYQLYSRDNVAKVKVLARDLRRNHTVLLRDVRIFVGDGGVIENGAVLIRNGKIAEIYRGQAPDPQTLKAEAVEGAGKTLLPGLIDVHAHLAAPGGFFEKAADYQPEKTIPHALAAYLYSGVTAVKSCGDPLDTLLAERAQFSSGEKLGAELFLVGPMFTAEGGHGTEYTREVPQQYRKMMEQQIVRLPKTAEEARRQVDELKRRGVDGIKAILEAGEPGMLFNRMDVSILKAIAGEARADGLPIVCHTGNAQDVADALDAGVNGIEHGSFRDAIPGSTFERMKRLGVTYDPTLVVMEAFSDLAAGKTDPLDRSLVQQVAPPGLLPFTKSYLESEKGAAMREGFRHLTMTLDQGRENLLRAWKNGVTPVTGSDSGNPLVIHGPAIHRELQLWVAAGIPPAVALRAATYNAARLLGADRRIGLIRKGYDATLLLVDGNPLRDISVTERISQIYFKGERVRRVELFDDDK